MAFIKRGQDPYEETDPAEDWEDEAENWDEGSGASILDKASRTIKGLFSRGDKEKENEEQPFIPTYRKDGSAEEEDGVFGGLSFDKTEDAPDEELFGGLDFENWGGNAPAETAPEKKDEDPFLSFAQPEPAPRIRLFPEEDEAAAEERRSYVGRHFAPEESGGAADTLSFDDGSPETEEYGDEEFDLDSIRALLGDEPSAEEPFITEYPEEENYEEEAQEEYYGEEEYPADEYADEEYYGEEEYAEEYYAEEEYAEEEYYPEGEYADGGVDALLNEFGGDAPEEYADDYSWEYDEDYEEDTEEPSPAPVKTAGGSHSAAPAGKLNLHFSMDGVNSYLKKYESYLLPGAGVIALCALLTIVFALSTLFSGRAERKAAEKQEQEQVYSVPTATPTPAELQANGELPSDTAGEQLMVRAKRDENGALAPAGDQPADAVVPQRGPVLSVDSFRTATHIGNSFVTGMRLWSDIDTCAYVCEDGVSLDNMIGNYLYYITVRDYDAIYLTLGLNEIGWPVDTFIAKYERVIDYIRSDCYEGTRDATIYVTSVFPVEEIMETTPGENGSTISKETILKFNEELKKMCARKGVWYLDVYSALAGPDGYLPATVAADDHVHFEKTGYRIWSDYMRSHYVDDSMLQE